MSYFNINITPELREKAFKQATGLPHFPKNFKRNMDEYDDGELTAKIEGVLGELAVEEWLIENDFGFIDNRENPKFDYLVGEFAKIEVKAKTRKVNPEGSHEATVPEYVHQYQKPGFYIFISHKVDPKKNKNDIDRYTNSYIVGGIDRKTFDLHSRHLKTGDYDHSNDWYCKKSCYNIYIRQLLPMNEFSERLKRWNQRHAERNSRIKSSDLVSKVQR